MTEHRDEAGTATISDEEAERVFRVLAKTSPAGIPEWAQEAYGINNDGTIAESGLTDKGREHARGIHEGLHDAIARATAMFDRATRGDHECGAAPFADPFGLARPLRAALRAGAQTLAAALDDGASDDAGVDRARGLRGERVTLANGQRVSRYLLGGEPFVLLRLQHAPGGLAYVSAVTGGGALPGESGIIDPVELVEHGLDALRRGGGVESDLDTPDEVDRMTMEEAARRFGDDVEHLADLLTPDGSAAGPSTEWPGSGPVPDHLPGGTPTETPAPAASPVHDGGASSPAPSEPASTSSDSSGPGGGTD